MTETARMWDSKQDEREVLTNVLFTPLVTQIHNLSRVPLPQTLLEIGPQRPVILIIRQGVENKLSEIERWRFVFSFLFFVNK